MADYSRNVTTSAAGRGAVVYQYYLFLTAAIAAGLPAVIVEVSDAGHFASEAAAVTASGNAGGVWFVLRWTTARGGNTPEVFIGARTSSGVLAGFGHADLGALADATIAAGLYVVSAPDGGWIIEAGDPVDPKHYFDPTAKIVSCYTAVGGTAVWDATPCVVRADEGEAITATVGCEFYAEDDYLLIASIRQTANDPRIGWIIGPQTPFDATDTLPDVAWTGWPQIISGTNGAMNGNNNRVRIPNAARTAWYSGVCVDEGLWIDTYAVTRDGKWPNTLIRVVDVTNGQAYCHLKAIARCPASVTYNLVSSPAGSRICRKTVTMPRNAI